MFSIPHISSKFPENARMFTRINKASQDLLELGKPVIRSSWVSLSYIAIACVLPFFFLMTSKSLIQNSFKATCHSFSFTCKAFSLLIEITNFYIQFGENAISFLEINLLFIPDA